MTWGKWEVVNIIFRFVDMISWLPRQLLISVAFLGTSLNANGQLAEIIKAIQRLDLRDDLNGLIALIADRHGVNKKTVDKIESNVDLQAKCFLVGCCSHTLDNSGDHFNIPNGLCCVFVINFRLFNLLIVNCSSGNKTVAVVVDRSLQKQSNCRIDFPDNCQGIYLQTWSNEVVVQVDSITSISSLHREGLFVFE